MKGGRCAPQPSLPLMSMVWGSPPDAVGCKHWCKAGQSPDLGGRLREHFVAAIVRSFSGLFWRDALSGLMPTSWVGEAMHKATINSVLCTARGCSSERSKKQVRLRLMGQLGELCSVCYRLCTLPCADIVGRGRSCRSFEASKPVRRYRPVLTLMPC